LKLLKKRMKIHMTINEQGIQHSKHRRTNSWQRQPEFDNILGEISTSGLQFLQVKYEKQLHNYTSTHNVAEINEFEIYKEIQQRLKMINDEIYHRTTDSWASPSYYNINKYTFDSTTGLVYDEWGIPRYTFDLNEDESSLIQRDLEGAIVEEMDIPKESKIRKLNKRELYEHWDYYNEDDE